MHGKLCNDAMYSINAILRKKLSGRKSKYSPGVLKGLGRTEVGYNSAETDSPGRSGLQVLGGETPNLGVCGKNRPSLSCPWWVTCAWGVSNTNWVRQAEPSGDERSWGFTIWWSSLLVSKARKRAGVDNNGLSPIVERTRTERGGDSKRGVCGNGLDDVLLWVQPALFERVNVRGKSPQGLSHSNEAVATSGE